MKKILFYILISIILVGSSAPAYVLAEDPAPTSPNYVLLTPLPCEKGTENCPTGELTSFNPEQGLSSYLNLMIRIFIGICAVLAMIMIVLGGLEYMTSELVSSKESGKHKITGAVFGLIIALGSYALLNTINPDLLTTNVNVKGITIQVELEPEHGIPSKTITLQSNNGPVTLTACDESQMVWVNAFGQRVRVYKGIAKSLERISNRWLASREDLRYPVNSIFGYNCREVTNKPGSWSAHAFGLAIDINPNTNPYGEKLQEDLPPGFPALFTTEGWGWGGNWSSIKDPMHFSKYPASEGGNAQVEL